MEPIFQSEMQTVPTVGYELSAPSCSSIVGSSMLCEPPQQAIRNSSDTIKLSKTYILSDCTSNSLTLIPSLEQSASQGIRVVEAGHLTNYNVLSEFNVPSSAVQIQGTTAHSIAALSVDTDVGSGRLLTKSPLTHGVIETEGYDLPGYLTMQASNFSHAFPCIAPLHVMPISGTPVNIQIVGGTEHHNSMASTSMVAPSDNLQNNQMVARSDQPLLLSTDPRLNRILTCIMMPTAYVLSIPQADMVPVTQVIIPQTSGLSVHGVNFLISQEQNTDTRSQSGGPKVSEDKDVHNYAAIRRVITSGTEIRNIQNSVSEGEGFKSTKTVENTKTFLTEHSKQTTPEKHCDKMRCTESKAPQSHAHETDYVVRMPIILNKRQLYSPNGSCPVKHQKLSSLDQSLKYSMCDHNAKQNSDVKLSNCSNSVNAAKGNDKSQPTGVCAIAAPSIIDEENMAIEQKSNSGMVSLLHNADTVMQYSNLNETSAVLSESRMVALSQGYSLQNQSFSVDSFGNFVTQPSNQLCNSSALASESVRISGNLPSVSTSIPYVPDSNKQQETEILPIKTGIDESQTTGLSVAPYASGIEISRSCDQTPSIVNHHEVNRSNKTVSIICKIPQQLDKSYKNSDMAEDSHEHSGKGELYSTVGKSNITEATVKLTPDREHYPLVDVNNSATQQERLAWNKSSLTDKPHDMPADLKDNKMECNLCNATFTKLGNYTRHQMTHTVGVSDSFRYSCHECNRSFLQQCDLRRHLLIHKDQQPHRCQVCGKGYIRRSDLVVHLRFHNQERMFKCPQCTKSFFQSGDLKRHIRNIHQRVCMLTCGHCANTFVSEQTLLRHVQMKHKDFIMTSIQEKVKSKCSQFTLAVAKRGPHQDHKVLAESKDVEKATGFTKAGQDHPAKGTPVSKDQDVGQTKSRNEENAFDDHS